MIIVTNQYSTNVIEGIDQCQMMRESFQQHGHELAILPDTFKGNGNVMRILYECYKRAATGHEKFVYSDGGDTYCQRPILDYEIPSDHILYSAEQACYPKVEVASRYKPTKSKWKYLNGGNYCGPLPLIIEFFEKYNLHKQKSDCNGQHEQMMAYLQAVEDGFPIQLDTDCKLFQTTAFADPSEFECKNGLIHNIKTKTIPAVFHGNGRSPMQWVYEAKDKVDEVKETPKAPAKRKKK